jgi:hypothetical protein
MSQVIGNAEISVREVRQQQARLLPVFQQQGYGDAYANHHLPVRKNRKALDKDAVSACGRYQHRVAPLSDGYLFVCGSDLTAATKSRFTRFAVHPQGQPGYHTSGRQLDLGARLS